MADLFDDREDFAIEVGVEPDGHTASTVWGHMCVWCRAVALGDIGDTHCGIDHAYVEFAWLVDNLNRLWADELVGLDDVAAWNFLDGILYGYHGDIELAEDCALDDLRRDSARWGWFDFLTNWGEQFDGYKSFLLCPPGDMARVLSDRLPPGMGLGVAVSRRGLIDAASGFVAWFESESQRLGVPCRRDS